jgi:hypothetical protein
MRDKPVTVGDIIEMDRVLVDIQEETKSEQSTPELKAPKRVLLIFNGYNVVLTYVLQNIGADFSFYRQDQSSTNVENAKKKTKTAPCEKGVQSLQLLRCL